MKCTFLLIVLLYISNLSTAQDTLWAQCSRNDVPFVYAKSKAGESIYDIARKYSVPPGFLSDLNGVRLQQQLSPATAIKIPIGSYNYRRVNDPAGNRPLFYKVREGDKLYELARSFNTSQQSLQQWNKLSNQEIAPGQILLTGWISYDQSQEGSKAPDQVPVPIPLPVVKDTISVKETITAEESSADSMQVILEKNYYDGNSGRSEAGAAVFFESAAPAQPGIYYAFHNIAERGDIIKVHNPDGNRSVYVKVIGRIPELKEYHNCIIAISDKAAKALGAHYKRTFCRISY